MRSSIGELRSSLTVTRVNQLQLNCPKARRVWACGTSLKGTVPFLCRFQVPVKYRSYTFIKFLQVFLEIRYFGLLF